VRGSRPAARIVVVGLALCAGSIACAAVVGLEDKQPYDADAAASGDGSATADGAAPSDAPSRPDSPFAIGPPETFATGQSKPWGVAVDDAYVYWTNEGDDTVMRAPKGGGEPAIIARSQAEPHRILVDSTNVIWHNANFASVTQGDGGTNVYEISSLSKSTIATGELPRKIEDVQGGQKARSIAIARSPDDQIWSTWRDKVRRNNREDSNNGKDVMKPLDPREPTALAVDDTNAYFFLQQPEQVWRIPKTADGMTDAGRPVVVLDNMPEVADMAADGTALYIVTIGGALLEVPTPNGGVVTTLASGHPFPRNVVLDDAFVYFTHSSAVESDTDGAVIMVAKAGGDAVRIAKAQNRPRGIAVDIAPDGSHTVYWATYGDGKIQRARVR
jgi:hypothetical protein